VLGPHLAVARLPCFSAGHTPPTSAAAGHTAPPYRCVGPHAPPHSSPPHGASHGPSPLTPPCPLKRVPHRCHTPISSPSHFSPSPATREHPSLSLLGLVSTPDDRTAAARTVFTPSCHLFPRPGSPSLPPPPHLVAVPARGRHRSLEHRRQGERCRPKHLLRLTDVGTPQ
jgi:hypothetical protein